jgi:CheY-like chemotaxis protein
VEKPIVLLVDDNEATCTLVTALLCRDFRVECAGDGLEAIEKLRAGRYSAVILDVRMPQLDGFGVLDHLERERPDLLARVIVLTAAVSRQEAERLRRYRVARVIPKPFEIEHLLSSVRDVTGDDGRATIGGPFLSSGMLLLIADLLKNRLM